MHPKSRLFTRSLSFISVLAAGVLASPQAWAVNTNSNRQIFPLGETESFMANTGVGRAVDTGAVYYNPAGLAEMHATGRVSVTGSVYLNFNTRTDALINVDGTNVSYEASGFNTIPAFYVASYKFGEWYGAISVLVPNSLQYENQVPFSTPNTQSNLLQSNRVSDLWVGASVAHKIDSQWSLGFTLFGVQHQEALTLGIDVGSRAAPTTTSSTSIAQVTQSVKGVSGVFGVSYVPSSWFRMGLRAQTPMIQIDGTADTFQVIRTVSGGKITTSGETLNATLAKYRLPFDFTLGTALTPSDWFAFLADVSLQLGAHYSSIPGSVFNDEVDLKPTPRINLGMEFKPVSWLPVRTGFYYNPSANSGDAGSEGFLQENFYGVTLGVGINTARVETGIGGFYIWSTGKTTPQGAPGTTAAIASHGVGGLLTASYLL